MFAAIEKARLYVLRGCDSEEPQASKGYICEFKGLEVTTVQMESVMSNPRNVDVREHVVKFEALALRETRDLLCRVVVVVNLVVVNSTLLCMCVL